MKFKKSALVGKWFHSFKDGKLCCQGQILSQEQDGYFLVETYDWLCGESFNQQLVHFGDMVNWRFYQTDEDMRYHSKKYEREFWREKA